MLKDTKVIFMGTPEFAKSTLEMLINETKVILVVTQPDKIVGRKKEIQMPIIKKIALANNIDVFQPIKIREDYQKIVDLKPDLIVTCAYGQIIPKEILNCSKYGCLNIHGSLLPKYRGAAPIQWALLNGEEYTGITLMYMDEHMDTGDIIDLIKIKISPEDNYETLAKKLSQEGTLLLQNNLEKIINNKINRIKQNDIEATYAPMIKREDEQINFNDLGEKINNKIKALNPYPLAYVKINKEEVKVIKARFEKNSFKEVGKIMITKSDLGITTKDGILYLEKIKPFGKKEMDIKSYLNGLQKEKINNTYVGD